MHNAIRKMCHVLTLAVLCSTPALAQTADIPSLFSLSQGNAADRANYRDIIAGGIRDVPCVNVDSKDLAQAQVWAQNDMKAGFKDYATCPKGHIDLISVAPPVTAAEIAREKAREQPLTTPAVTWTSADVNAFNDTIAAGSSRGCGAMASALNLIHPKPVYDAATGKVMNAGAMPLNIWVQGATGAKVCVAAVHAETSDAVPIRLPKLALAQMCAYLKANLAHPQDDVAASQSSWACGWPAPMPQLRTVPVVDGVH